MYKKGEPSFEIDFRYNPEIDADYLSEHSLEEIFKFDEIINLASKVGLPENAQDYLNQHYLECFDAFSLVTEAQEQIYQQESNKEQAALDYLEKTKPRFRTNKDIAKVIFDISVPEQIDDDYDDIVEEVEINQFQEPIKTILRSVVLANSMEQKLQALTDQSTGSLEDLREVSESVTSWVEEMIEDNPLKLIQDLDLQISNIYPDQVNSERPKLRLLSS